MWKRAGLPPPKKAKTVLLANKVMASVFWDSKGVILVDHLKRGKTVNLVYCCNFSHRLREEIKEKCQGILRKKVLFYQVIARVHTSVQSIAKIHNCGFEIRLHPAYFSDLAPSEFYLFPNLKKHSGGMKFSSNDEVQIAINECFESLEESFFKQI